MSATKSRPLLLLEGGVQAWGLANHVLTCIQARIP